MMDTSPLYALSQVRIARLVLEAVTPLSIGTGNPDGVFDSALVRDANDLPAIPATSLAGVLRHLWTQTHGPESARQLFGYQERNQGQTSRVRIGWGHLLDSKGRAACGLLLGADAARLQTDPLFAEALRQRDEPAHRNRVRLTHRGAAAETGKFDRTVLPAGHRFAVELRLDGGADDTSDSWDALLALFAHPGFRLGGGTRAGLGRLRCISLHTAQFDLRQPAQARALGQLGADPSHTAGLAATPVPQRPSADWIETTLTLDARSLWRIGQGDLPVGLTAGQDKAPDLLPITERRVTWTGGEGKLTTERALLLPAASLKGVLAHRMAFHARRFAGQWAGQPQAADPAQPPAEVQALMGSIKDSGGKDRAEQGWAGCLFIDDTYLPVPGSVNLMHNSIDRFTGGVRAHMLFEEQNILGGKPQVRIALDLQRLRAAAQVHHTRIDAIQRAFLAALRDLGEGRLALGARSTSGNGFFRAELPAALTADWPPQATQPHPEAA
ncbi:MAG: RAMP superfamily CRISPR-associated protein [Thiomonas sp.]